MISLERILWAATLPLESDESLRRAVALARAYKATLLLCHCAEAPALVSLLDDGVNVRQSKDELADSFARYLRPDLSRLRWEIIVPCDGKDIGETIVRTAREQRVDLIVMRSRRSRVAALLGTTAEQVSRTAPCPVLVVHPGQRVGGASADDRGAGFRSVLVSYDFSSSSELALSYALSIAQKFRADLHLMHVLPAPEEDDPEIAWNEMGLESAYHRATRRLQALVPEEVYRRCRVINVVRWGKPYREVLGYAAEQDVDLIAMGALGSDFGFRALFGSNADRVLRQAVCPVLVARPLQNFLRESLIAAADGTRVGNRLGASTARAKGGRSDMSREA
jgi:universal stress protein A